MNPEILLQILSSLSAAAILWRAEPALNIMGGNCRLSVRIAFWLLMVGASGHLVMITQGYSPSVPCALALAGTALLLISERRIKALLHMNCKPRIKDRRAAQ